MPTYDLIPLSLCFTKPVRWGLLAITLGLSSHLHASVAGNSLVRTPNGTTKISLITKGSDVMVSGLNRVLASARVKVTASSTVGSKALAVYLRYRTVSGQQTLVVSTDQLLVVQEGSHFLLRNADQLLPNTKLATFDKQDAVIQSVSIGNYTGQMYAISTSTARPDKNYSGHIIVVQGLLLADYYACVYRH